MKTKNTSMLFPMAGCSYRQVGAQLINGIKQVLLPGHREMIDTMLPEFPSMKRAIDAMGSLRHLLSLKKAVDVRRVIVSITNDTEIPWSAKMMAVDYYFSYCGMEDTDWVLSICNEKRCRLPYHQLVWASFLLKSGDYRAACLMVRQVYMMDPAMTASYLSQRAMNFYRWGRRRAAIFCWKYAYKTKQLAPSACLEMCMFLLDAGHLVSVQGLWASIPDTNMPEDAFRRLLIRGVLESLSDEQVRKEADELWRRYPNAPSLLWMLNPFAQYLAGRLQPIACLAHDVRLAGYYALLLDAEWKQGRFHSDSLLTGSKFGVFTGGIKGVMAVMKARVQADPSFVDGFAALAVYAWSAGLTREASECLSKEPLDRPHAPMGWFRLAVAAGLLQKKKEAGYFLEQLFVHAPNFFVRDTPEAVWGMLAVLLKTLGHGKRSRQAEARARPYPLWKHMRWMLNRCPVASTPLPLPGFAWPDA